MYIYIKYRRIVQLERLQIRARKRYQNLPNDEKEKYVRVRYKNLPKHEKQNLAECRIDY